MKKILVTIYLWMRSFFVVKKQPLYIPSPRRKVAKQLTINHHCRNRKKEPWVTDKVLYLKAITGFGCGKVAQTFNRLYGDRETVSKSFVYDKLKNNRYRLRAIKRDIRYKPPKAVPINHTWGMDLTTVTLNGRQKTILGIIDHGSRMCLMLEELKSAHSWQILTAVAQTIRRYGLPQYVRTDNGRNFTSAVCEIAFKLLGIKHRKTNIASPWQNGRIERFFGSFKPLFKKAIFNTEADLQTQLDVFTVWYNQTRPHDNLEGLIPQEAWQGEPIRRNRKALLVGGWDGILTGYYFPH